MKNKIKILFVIPNSQISGAEGQLLLLIENLDRNQFDIETSCLEGEGPFSDYVKSIGFITNDFDRKMSYDFSRLIKLYKLIKRKKYDIIIPFCWSAIQYTRLASYLLPSIHVACERGHDYDKISIENIISMFLDPISELIIFNSKNQMNGFLNNFRFKKVPVKTIYNGINIDSFKGDKIDTLHNGLKISKGTKLIGTVGNFTKVKNFEMFIDVCERISNKYGNVKFLAIGDGHNRKIYESIVVSKNLQKKLIFLGYKKEINQIFPMLDIFLLTSNREGMPNVIMEAMASKIPVISTSIDGAKELINHETNGFLVERKDISGMVNIILNIFKDNYDIDKIKSNAYENISKNFSVNKMVNQYEETFIYLYENK